jgi:hypothetical protein
MSSSLNSYLNSVFFIYIYIYIEREREENLPKEREEVPVIRSKEQAEDGKLILLCIK